MTKRPTFWFRREATRPSPDDWHPTIDGMVALTFANLSNDQWRVCVWGGDDCGMERDFDVADFDQAERLFEELSNAAFITKAMCAERGLRYC